MSHTTFEQPENLAQLENPFRPVSGWPALSGAVHQLSLKGELLKQPTTNNQQPFRTFEKPENLQNPFPPVKIDIVLTLSYNIEKGGDSMAQATISIRIDPTLKNEFDQVCNDLGLSMSTAVVMLAKKMTREKRIPFDVSMDPFYSEANQKRLRASISQMEKTGGTIHQVPGDD